MQEPKRGAHRIARRAKINDQIESAQHDAKTLGEFGGDALEQKVSRRQSRGAIATPTPEYSVEYDRAFSHVVQPCRIVSCRLRDVARAFTRMLFLRQTHSRSGR
jgi:hypothetical protein